MRTILVIEKDLERCDKQLCAALEAKNMTPADKKIVIDGFMKKKEKLKAELKVQEELARRMAMGDKTITKLN